MHAGGFGYFPHSHSALSGEAFVSKSRYCPIQLYPFGAAELAESHLPHTARGGICALSAAFQCRIRTFGFQRIARA